MKVLSQKWLLEVLWILGSVILSALILLPIIESGMRFPWLSYNFVYLFAGMTLIRYVFQFDHHPLAKSKIFKTLLIFVVPILFFPIIEGLHSFIEFNDREGLTSLLDHLSYRKQHRYASYINAEYMLAGVTCFVGAFALIVKMIRSLWRQVKYGQV